MKAARGMDKMYPINFTNNPDAVTNVGPNNRSVKALYGYKFKSSDKETLFIINLDSNSHTVKINNLFVAGSTGSFFLTQYYSSKPYVGAVYEGLTNIKKITSTTESDTFDANAFSITVIEKQSVLGIEVAEKLQFNIYPNPVKNYIQIEGLQNIDEVSIYSLNGVKLLVIKNPSSKINLDNLDPGMYFIKVESNNRTGFSKFIKE